jgi:hypothetical protein
VLGIKLAWVLCLAMLFFSLLLPREKHLVIVSDPGDVGHSARLYPSLD